MLWKRVCLWIGILAVLVLGTFWLWTKRAPQRIDLSFPVMLEQDMRYSTQHESVKDYHAANNAPSVSWCSIQGSLYGSRRFEGNIFLDGQNITNRYPLRISFEDGIARLAYTAAQGEGDDIMRTWTLRLTKELDALLLTTGVRQDDGSFSVADGDFYVLAVGPAETREESDAIVARFRALDESKTRNVDLDWDFGDWELLN